MAGDETTRLRADGSTASAIPTITRPKEREAQPGRESIEALLAFHGPEGARELLPAGKLDDLGTRGWASVETIVVVGDLRKSTFVMKEAVRPSLYAQTLQEFTSEIRNRVRTYKGWFDKFTGDGFIVYWLVGDDGKLHVSEVLGFCHTILSMSTTLISNLRMNSRNFPDGVGLSIGVDFGPCEMVVAGGSLTLVGAPIVGATRMVNAAAVSQTLVNVYLGELLDRHENRAALGREGIVVREKKVGTKEYPDGQVAYEVEFTRREGSIPYQS